MPDLQALTVDGFLIYPEALDRTAQSTLLETLRTIVAQAPFYRPEMPRTATPYSVTMTNCGPLGWVSDREGYRYQSTHPRTGKPWPAMPPALLDIWERLSGWPHPPEAALINLYKEKAKLGLHVDATEDDMTAPVVSISLGDTCLFRIGGTTRRGPTRSLKLASGAVVVMGGSARACYHGVDRIYPGTSNLIEGGGRVNVTLRRVTCPA